MEENHLDEQIDQLSIQLEQESQDLIDLAEQQIVDIWEKIDIIQYQLSKESTNEDR